MQEFNILLWFSGHDAYEATEDGFYSINVKTGEKLKKYFDIRELVNIFKDYFDIRCL